MEGEVSQPVEGGGWELSLYSYMGTFKWTLPQTS